MIRPYALIVIVSLFSVLTALIGYTIVPSKKSENRYLKLIKQTKEEKVLAATHKQNREGVRKDLFVARPGHRLRTVLTCPVSELTLSYDRGESEVVENLKKFHCVMQEEVYNVDGEGGKIPLNVRGEPMQVVRDFDALSGQFYYQRQRLAAERAFVSRYTLPGHEMPELIEDVLPMMKGVARSAELDFGNGIKFKTRHLKAALFLRGISQ